MAGTIAATNPIVADGNGYWPQRYVSEDAKAVVTDADDVALYTLDPVPTAQGSGAAASAISFTPSLDLPQTNVQDAIEAAATLATSGFASFGLGITGNATLLANIDATGTGAGIYRFDGTTTGILPTGVAAADTGMVELWRQAGATAMQFLFHATSDRVFHRRMASSTWGAWREVLTSNQALAEGDTFYRGASSIARLPKGTAGQVLTMNSGATAPEWGNSSIKARINFNGVPVIGLSYSRTGTLVTITQTGHGMSSGQWVSLNFTSGTATDGYYTITVVDVNTYTVVDAASGSTSGLVNRDIWVRSQFNISSVTYNNAGDYTINFATPMTNAGFAYSHAYSNETNNQHAIGFFSSQTVNNLRVEHYDASLGSRTANKSTVSIIVSD